MSLYQSESNPLPAPEAPKVLPLVPRPPSSEPTATLGTTTQKDKEDIRHNPIQYYVKASFMITYILLLTTATVTFIEAMRTKIPDVRHVLNLETCISIVAGYFYSVFLAQIEGYGKEDKPVDWRDITKTRYIDWSITTPLMLLTLCVVLASHINKKVNLGTLSIIILLNYAMLFIGFLGETKVLSTAFATIGGFVPFAAMFYLVYVNFVKPKYLFANYVLYFFYVFVWALYGLVYLLPETWKNISMNILDCIAKCLIGLGLWVYYSHTVSI
jgi:bacteriorhodopsin